MPVRPVRRPAPKQPALSKKQQVAAMREEAARFAATGTYTIEEITDHLRSMGLIQDRVREDAIRKAEISDVKNALKTEKIKTPGEFYGIRAWGSFPVKEDHEDGTVKDRACWKTWMDMDRAEMWYAQIGLFIQARSTLTEAVKVHNFCNKLLADRTEELLARGDVDANGQ